MTRQLRQGRGKTGLVLANGGVVTYQAAVCLSSSPRRDGLPYPEANPLPDLVKDVQTPTVDEKAEGDATIEVRNVEPIIKARVADSTFAPDIHCRV